MPPSRTYETTEEVVHADSSMPQFAGPKKARNSPPFSGTPAKDAVTERTPSAEETDSTAMNGVYV